MGKIGKMRKLGNFDVVQKKLAGVVKLETTAWSEQCFIPGAVAVAWSK